ncbi:hypothetical protein [Desulfosporosinus sp. BG]|uniref:hypothetical protein n=1 Tax=Desulfosporosinus sp. BG TaxID=1633135 RepID=UPI00083A5853|nr:hypothetical protein [Desulfosporosinus sp. BG]
MRHAIKTTIQTNAKDAKRPVFVEKNVKGEIITKTCSICGEYKELEDFPKNKKGFAGCASACKACNTKARSTPPSPESLALKVIRDRWAAVGRTDLEALYAEGLSEDQIAEKFEVSIGRVVVRRHQCGIPNPNPKVISLADRPRRPW